MESVAVNDLAYQRAPLPKLKSGQDIARRDSLSSSRTQDSGYISDRDFSLSPLELVCPEQMLPHDSSDFTWDSSALFDVKEVAFSRTKRPALPSCNPQFAKKHKLLKDISAPRIEVTSNPIHGNTSSNADWTPALERPTENIELWINDNLQPQQNPKERNLSIVSLDSTGSCDMYSNVEDNSDDEHGANTQPGTMSKATSKTIELIMRKVEIKLAHAAYTQCAGGNQGSKVQSTPNSTRAQRGSQASSGKRKSRSDDILPPPDEDDEDDSNKRRRVSVTTTTEDSETGPRFACPFFKHDPNRYRHRRSCIGPGWPTVHRMKEHLYRSHAQPIFCPRCYSMFDSDSEFSGHIRGPPCQISEPQPIEGIDRRTFESLKKRSPPYRLEEDKWRDAYQLLFPDVAEADIPSPYYDTASPTEQSRHFRRELLTRIRTRLLATADAESGPVEQRLLRQVASIIRECEDDLLNTFHPSSESEPRYPDHPAAPPPGDPGAAPPPPPPPPQQTAWPFYDLINWNMVFPPGEGERHAEFQVQQEFRGPMWEGGGMEVGGMR